MKIRNGFVSNSSSSSFILVGIRLDKNVSTEELSRKYITESAINKYMGDDADKYVGVDSGGWWNDLWNECAYNGDFINQGVDFISDDYNNFIGRILVDDDAELPDGEFTLSELIKISEKYNFGKDCKLYFGTRQC